MRLALSSPGAARAPLFVLLSALVFASPAHTAPAAFSIPADARSIEAPKRLQGLWAMETAPTERAGGAPEFHQCIATGSDDVLAFPGNELSNCREAQWLKDRHYSYYRASCERAGARTTVLGRFAGDFEYNYQGELVVDADSAAPQRIELAGRRLAPCRGNIPVGKFLIEGRDGVRNLNTGEAITPAR